MPNHRDSPFASPFVRRFAALAAALIVAVSAGCGDGATDAGTEEDPDRLTPTELIRLSWLGTFIGPGRGSVGEDVVTTDSSRLTFRIDADSVRPADCPLCVTVTLDTLFSLVNVRINDAVRLNLQYTRDGKDWGLLVERFSAGGATGNIAQARLLAQPLDGGPIAVDMAYIMERPLN